MTHGRRMEKTVQRWSLMADGKKRRGESASLADERRDSVDGVEARRGRRFAGLCLLVWPVGVWGMKVGRSCQ